MADPVKPLDRLKPFQRINNDAFVRSTATDGDGVSCGCHTPDEFGPLEKEFLDFIDSNLPLPLLKVLQTVDDIAKAAAAAAKGTAAALAGILAGLKGLLGGPITSVIAAILGFATALAAISSFLDSVVGAINDVLKLFFAKIGRRLALRAIRVVPQWVPVVKGASNRNITKDQIIEVEGTVTRSFGDPIEVPFFQWHRWLNWSVQVQPEDKYKNVLSPAGNPPNTDDMKAGERAIPRSGSFEIQWDVGALRETFTGKLDTPFETGFDDTDMPAIDGPMTDGEWIWPMTGMFVWASGRFVYDCSRTTSGAKPQMCSMLNPPRAIATATWEAVQFSENLSGDPKSPPTKVPAIRFMFFTCKRGGYISYDSISDQDYEFILDLPPFKTAVSPFPIGHTPDFPHNTIVIRPRLLRSLTSLPDAGAKLIEPVIEVLAAEEAGAAPKQVKVTIKGDSIGKAEAAGVILSLGWFDPNLEQAATVKKCAVAFSGLEGRLVVRDSPVQQIRDFFKKEEAEMRKEIADRVANIKILGLKLDDIPVIVNPLNKNQKIDLGAELKKMVKQAVDSALDGLFTELGKIIAGKTEKEEWLLRVGVNGRWQTRYFPNLDKGAFALPKPAVFEVFLGPDDFLFFSTSGIEYNPVGDMMRAPRTDRIITRNNAQLTWVDIASAAGTQRRDIVFQYALKVLTGNSKTGALALGIENTPLGVIDPDFSRPGDIPEASNPLRMKNVQPDSVNVRGIARFARATGEEFILVENPNQDDYHLTALLQISKQIP